MCVVFASFFAASFTTFGAMRPIDTDYHHVCFLHRPVFSTRKLKEVETRRAKMERLSRSQAHRIRVRGSARFARCERGAFRR